MFPTLKCFHVKTGPMTQYRNNKPRRIYENARSRSARHRHCCARGCDTCEFALYPVGICWSRNTAVNVTPIRRSWKSCSRSSILN